MCIALNNGLSTIGAEAGPVVGVPNVRNIEAMSIDVIKLRHATSASIKALRASLGRIETRNVSDYGLRIIGQLFTVVFHNC